MTYRNDHDAALARIDALESELARARADDGANAARAELDRLESEIKRRRVERDRLEREVEDAVPKRKRLGAKLAVALAGVALIAAYFAAAEKKRAPTGPSQLPSYSPPPPTPAPTVPRSATRLVDCANELSRAIAEHTTSSQTCIEQIRTASKDPVLGVDVHNLLARWLTAEETPSLEQRDALEPEIHRVIIPSFTH
jgi:hypothetical protein